MGLINTTALVLGILKILKLVNLSWWYVVALLVIDFLISISTILFKRYMRKHLLEYIRQL